MEAPFDEARVEEGTLLLMLELHVSILSLVEWAGNLELSPLHPDILFTGHFRAEHVSLYVIESLLLIPEDAVTESR